MLLYPFRLMFHYLLWGYERLLSCIHPIVILNLQQFRCTYDSLKDRGLWGDSCLEQLPGHFGERCLYVTKQPRYVHVANPFAMEWFITKYVLYPSSIKCTEEQLNRDHPPAKTRKENNKANHHNGNHNNESREITTMDKWMVKVRPNPLGCKKWHT